MDVSSHIRSLYRHFLHISRHSPSSLNFNSLEKLKYRFRERISDEAQLNEALKEAEQRLAYLRCITPKRMQRGSSRQQTFHIENEQLIVGPAPIDVSVRTQRAQYSITSEEIRRNNELMERFQFKGKHWEGKQKPVPSIAKHMALQQARERNQLKR